MNELKTDRPIVDFDIESTGLNTATARIVQIAVSKTIPDGTVDVRQMIIDPECEIPKEASDVHGITNEVIEKLKAEGKKVPTFPAISKALYKFIDGCHLRGYNIKDYDIPLLAEEFARAGIDFWGEDTIFPKPDVLVFDACVIFKKMEERTLTAALKFYCDKVMVDAHNALADINAAKDVFLAQVERYDELKGKTPEEIAEFCKRDNRVDLAGLFIRKDDNKVYFAFGKHKNKKVSDVFKTDTNYYTWMIEKGEFTSNTKRHAREMYAMIHKTT